MLETIFSLLVLAILTLPELALLVLIVNLILFLRTPKENTELRTKYRFWVIVAGVSLGVLIAALACLMILSAGAITFM